MSLILYEYKINDKSLCKIFKTWNTIELDYVKLICNEVKNILNSTSSKMVENTKKSRYPSFKIRTEYSIYKYIIHNLINER